MVRKNIVVIVFIVLLCLNFGGCNEYRGVKLGEKDQQLILNSLAEYYLAIDKKDTESIINSSYYETKEDEQISRAEFEIAWQSGISYSNSVSGVNLYSVRENKDGKIEALIVYANKSRYIIKKGPAKIPVFIFKSNQKTDMCMATMILDNDTWKFKDSKELCNITIKGESDTSYNDKLEDYETEYIEWYLGNDQVHTNKEMYYVFTDEKYEIE